MASDGVMPSDTLLPVVDMRHGPTAPNLEYSLKVQLSWTPDTGTGWLGGGVVEVDVVVVVPGPGSGGTHATARTVASATPAPLSRRRPRRCFDRCITDLPCCRW